MLISKFSGYVLIHLLNFGVPSALCLKTFNWYSISFGIICKSFSNWYMQGKQLFPGGMQGSKFIQLISLKYPIDFRATSVHDMI